MRSKDLEFPEQDLCKGSRGILALNLNPAATAREKVCQPVPLNSKESFVALCPNLIKNDVSVGVEEAQFDHAR